MYKVTTHEFAHMGGEESYQVLPMDAGRFEEFLHAADINRYLCDDFEDAEETERWTITFNSSLRRTACRVMRIEDAEKEIYAFGSDTVPEHLGYHVDGKFEEKLSHIYTGESEDCAA